MLRRLLLILILLNSTLYLFANNIYSFTQISLKDGLSQSNVSTTLRDSYGRLWVGTRDGLNLHDGYRIKTFFHSHKDNTSIPANSIFDLAEALDGTILIATSKGVARYDEASDSFSHIYCDSKAIGFSNLCSVEGVVYVIGEDKALYLYDTKSASFERVFQLEFPDDSSIELTEMIVGCDNSELLIGSYNQGLWRIDIDEKRLERVEWYPYNDAIKLYRDDSSIYVAPFKRGIYRYTLEGDELAHIAVDNLNGEASIITSLLHHNATLWIGTDGDGVATYQFRSEGGSNAATPLNSDSFKASTIIHIGRNDDKSLWIGTYKNGLYALKENRISVYNESRSEEHLGLSQKDINCLFLDNDDHLSGSGDIVWIGTNGSVKGGLNSFNTKTKEFRHYPSTSLFKIVSIVDWSKDELLISAFSQGVYIFNKRSGKIREFIIKDRKTNQSITQRGIPIIFVRSDEKFYILSNHNYLYDRAKNTFSNIEDLNDLSNSGVYPIHQTDSCAYLAAPYDVYSLRFRDNKAQLLYSAKFGNERINAITIDKDGNIWYVEGMGLQMWNIATNKHRFIESTSNLRITSLGIDGDNNLWLGATNSLYSYDIESEVLSKCNQVEEVYSEYLYRPTPSLELRDGSIVMAVADGFIHIPRENVGDEQIAEDTKLSVKTIYINEKEVESSRLKESLSQISAPYNSTIRIECLINSSDIFYSRQLRYSLNGNPYIYTSDDNITLNMLKSGDYDITIECSTPNGNWVRIDQYIAIESVWWLSLRFILLWIMLIVIIVVAIFLNYRNKKAEQYRLKLLEQQEKVNTEKIMLFANINHELRTPLTLIYNSLKDILKEVGETSHTKNIIMSTIKHVTRMKSIINMILDINKIDNGGATASMQKGVIELNEWCRSFVEEFSLSVRNDKIDIEFVASEEVDCVLFDENRLSIVMSNLLINAIKFSPIDSTIMVKCSKVGEFVKISVEDQGSGIQGDIESLFAPYYQERHNKAGFGLGLPYSKSIIELHNGKIGAYNNPDSRGATFWFTIPLSNVDSMPKVELVGGVQQLQEVKSQVAMERLIQLKEFSVVVVEDEKDLREYIVAKFKNYFKKVYQAENGSVALDIIKAKSPDIIISDVIMPVMDGFMLCQKVKTDEELSHMPIVLLTGCNDDKNVELGYKLGADQYLMKPIDINNLLQIAQNIIRHRLNILKKNQTVVSKIDPITTTFSLKDEQFLQKLNLIIDENISDSALDVNMICTQMAMSRSTLYNKMKSVVGVGINEYIVRVRVDKAQQLLKETSMQIVEISEQLGFSSQTYFSTVFKNEMKMTPNKYRKEFFVKEG